jgi:hypothetical protein
LKYPDDALGAFRPIQTDRDNFTSTATRFASAKFRKAFLKLPEERLASSKKRAGRLRMGAFFYD